MFRSSMLSVSQGRRLRVIPKRLYLRTKLHGYKDLLLIDKAVRYFKLKLLSVMYLFFLWLLQCFYPLKSPKMGPLLTFRCPGRMGWCEARKLKF